MKSRRIVLFVFCLLVLTTAGCFQRFQRLEIKSAEEGIIFTHSRMERAFEQKNLCVFGEIIVSRRNETGDYENFWFAQNVASGFQKSTEAMQKPYIVYGESLPQTVLRFPPKPLTEGTYRVNAVVGIYNENRELLEELNLKDEFVLKTDAAGKLIVSTANK